MPRSAPGGCSAGGGPVARGVRSSVVDAHPPQDAVAPFERLVQSRILAHSKIEAANAHGVVPGLHCGNGASSARAVGEGFRMTSVAVDLGLVGGEGREEAVVRVVPVLEVIHHEPLVAFRRRRVAFVTSGTPIAFVVAR